MTTLRWTLIVCGLVLLAAIYWWGRRDGRQQTENKEPAAGAPKAGPSLLEAEARALTAPDQVLPSVSEPIQQVPFESTARVEPTLEDAAFQTEAADALIGATAANEDQASEPAVLPASKIIALRLVASVPRFSGAPLRTALEAESLEFGKYQIFHRALPEGVVFSVASMVEPGSFDLEHMFDEQYPGIVLFTQLPGPLDGATMLNELIACARKLQQSLGGVLQDEYGTPLQPARIEQLRREARDFESAHQARARSESSHP
jgi:cell division protein ZipA